MMKKGAGEVIPASSFVIMDYSGYTDNKDEPFDSTILRSDPWKGRLDQGHLLPCLEEAVLTMRKGEKSQFLVHYDLAFGELGCGERVPKRMLI
jgi:FK506-binding protein 6